MLDLDFEYDGIYLSEFGFIICNFDSSGKGTISEGSEITFDLSPTGMGEKHLVSRAKYDKCITAEFDICKNPAIYNGLTDEDKYITYDEERDLSRWLNRKVMLPFVLLSDHYEGVIFNGSFNLSKYELGGKIIGFRLKFTSDRPFGYLETTQQFTITVPAVSKTIYDESDEIGSTGVDMEITVKEAGTLTITNTFDGRVTTLNNCVADEVVTFRDMQIFSSDETHTTTLMNDFNFVFPMIGNTYDDRRNIYTFSLPCDVVLEYKSIRKVGV